MSGNRERVLAALIGAALSGASIMGVSAYTYDNVTTTVDTPTYDASEMVVQNKSNLSVNNDLKPVTTHTELGHYTGEITIKASWDDIANDEYTISSKPTEEEINALKSYRFSDGVGSSGITSGYVTKVYLDKDGYIYTLEGTGAEFDIVGDRTEDQVIAEDSSLTVKGNSTVLAQKSVSTTKDISVTENSELKATGAIAGANITTDGAVVAGGTEPASGISGVSITATGKVEGASISAQAGNLSAASVKATTGNITATGDVTASKGTISAQNLSAAAVTASGNGTIAGSLTVNGGINAGSRKISNVADPTANADAANKQYVDSKLATAGKTYTGAAGINVDGTTISVKSDGTNIITDTNGNITLGKNITGLTGISAETVNASRVTGLADPTADSDAVSKKYVQGLISSIDTTGFTGDMGNKKIFHLAPGVDETDAVNVKQMLDATGEALVNAKKYADDQDAANLQSAKDYADAQITASDALNVKYNADKTAVDIGGASFTTKGAGSFGSVAVGGLSITDGRITGLADPTADSDAVSKKYVQGLISAIDTTGFTGDMKNQKITNLAAGTEENDAVNKKQLDDAIQNVTAAGFSGDMKNGKIVNLAEGTADSDAVNVKQMKDADSATLTTAKKYADDQDATNLQNAKDYADQQVNAADALNVKYTSADKTAVDIGGASFTTTGAGSFGSVAVGSTSVTNGHITGIVTSSIKDKLDAVNKEYVDTAVASSSATGGKTYKAGNGIAISADDTISVVRGRVADKNNGFVTGGDVYASINPLRNNLNVMDGKLADQATLINTMQNSVSEIGGKVNSIISSVSSITGSFADNNLSNLSGTGLNVIQQEARKAVANYINTTGLTSFKAVTPVTKTYSVSAYSAENTTPVSEKAGDDLSTVSGRVSANETAIRKNTEDITGIKKAEGIDSDAWAKTLGTGKIEKDDNRLVTGSTVYSAMEKKADLDYVNALGEGLSQKIDMTSSQLTKDIAKAGAGAAALAALHPQDYDPDSKLDFAAGVGNYKSETATAVGLFYRPNSGTMFSLSGTIGNGDNMVNAGVSIKVGYGKTPEKVIITKTVYDRQQQRMAAQDEKIQNQDEEIRQLKAAVAKLIQERA